MKTITFASTKGGLGKSTLSSILASFLAMEHKVLFVDMDYQASVSKFFLLNIINSRKFIMNVINGGKGSGVADNLIEISDRFNPTIRSNLRLLPSDKRLGEYKQCEVSFLADALKEVSKDFNYCVVDTRSEENNLLFASMKAADLIIVPLSMHRFEYDESLELNRTIKEEGFAHKMCCVINQWEDTQKQHTYLGAVKTYIAQEDSTKLFSTCIPGSAVYRNYVDAFDTISTAFKTKKAHDAIVSFIKEIKEKLESN